VTVALDTGNVALESNTFDLAMGAGDNGATLELTSSAVSSNTIQLTGAEGADDVTVTVGSEGGSQNNNTLLFDLGAGANATQVIFAGEDAREENITVLGGHGADRFEAEATGSYVRNRTFLDLGAGANDVEIAHENGAFNSNNVNVEGAGGTDTVLLTMKGTGDSIANIIRADLGEGTNQYGVSLDKEWVCRNDIDFIGGSGADTVDIELISRSITKYSVNNDIDIDLGDGENQLDFSLSASNLGGGDRVDIIGGKDQDTVTVKLDASRGNMVVTTVNTDLGHGDNQFLLDLDMVLTGIGQSDFVTQAGDGDDVLTVEACSVVSALRCMDVETHAGHGDNTVCYDFHGRGITLQNNTVTAGHGQDTISLSYHLNDADISNNALTVESGAGDDTVAIAFFGDTDKSYASNQISATLGEGNNHFDYTLTAHGTVHSNQVVVHGGSENDSVTFNHSSSRGTMFNNDFTVNLGGGDTNVLNSVMTYGTCMTDVNYFVTGEEGNDSVDLSYASVASGVMRSNLLSINLKEGDNAFDLTEGGATRSGNVIRYTGGNDGDRVSIDDQGDGLLSSGQRYQINLKSGSNVFDFDGSADVYESVLFSVSGGIHDDQIALDVTGADAFTNNQIQTSLGNSTDSLAVCLEAICIEGNTIRHSDVLGNDTIQFDLSFASLRNNDVTISSSFNDDTIIINTSYDDNAVIENNIFRIDGGAGADQVIFRDFDTGASLSAFTGNVIDLIYTSASSFGDTITGGSTFLNNSLFNFTFSAGAFNGNAGGMVGADHFLSGADVTALDGDDYWLFDTESDTLYYDGDGNGNVEAVRVAEFTDEDVVLDHNDLLFA